MTSLIEELEACKCGSPLTEHESLHDAAIERCINIVRQRQHATEEKVIAAMNAEPIEVPRDEKGYFAWPKTPLQSGPDSEAADPMTSSSRKILEAIHAQHEAVCRFAVENGLSPTEIAGCHQSEGTVYRFWLERIDEKDPEKVALSREENYRLRKAVERLRAYIEGWILVLDPGTTVNVQMMQDEARKVLAGGEAP